MLATFGRTTILIIFVQTSGNFSQASCIGLQIALLLILLACTAYFPFSPSAMMESASRQDTLKLISPLESIYRRDHNTRSIALLDISVSIMSSAI